MLSLQTVGRRPFAGVSRDEIRTARAFSTLRFWQWVLLAGLLGCVAAANGQAATRVVGGTPIPISAAPWAVDVQFADSSDQYECSGSIITASLIATAASCLYDTNGNLEPLAGFTIIAGVSNDQTPASTDAEQTRQLSAMHIAPDYVNGAEGASDNVALLVVSAPFNLGGDVQAVQLPSPGSPFPAGQTVSMATFGEPSSGSTSTALESITATVEAQGVCGQPSSDAFIDNDASQFCTSTPTTGLCDGDAGAALVSTSGVLLGIASGNTVNCVAGSQIYSTYVGAGEILDFLQGNFNPTLAPASSETTATQIVWWGVVRVGSTLICTTGGWGGGVEVSFSFVNAATGAVLQSGPHATYLVPASALGTTILCESAVTGAGGTTLVRTAATAAVLPAGKSPEVAPRALSIAKVASDGAQRGRSVLLYVILDAGAALYGTDRVCITPPTMIAPSACVSLPDEGGGATYVSVQLEIRANAPLGAATLAIAASADGAHAHSTYSLKIAAA